MANEMNKLSVHVYGHEFEVHVPKEKEQLYLLAAEYVDKKIDTYMDAFVRIPLLQKSTQEILLMAMLDVAVGSSEYKQSSENSSLFGKIKNIIYSYEPRKRSERLFSVLREKVTYCDIFSARQGVLTRTE